MKDGGVAGGYSLFSAKEVTGKKTAVRKPPTSYRSANFSDDPETRTTICGYTIAKRSIMTKTFSRNKKTADYQVINCMRNEELQWQSDALETRRNGD